MPQHAHNDDPGDGPWPDEDATPHRCLRLPDATVADLRRQAREAVQAAFVLGLVAGGGLVLLGVLLRWWLDW